MSVLRLGRSSFGPGEFAVMAIVNRTPDSFYDRGATFAFEQAWRRVEQVVAEGADIVDVGGVKAGPGAPVDEDEEIARTADLVAAIHEKFADVVVSVDTYRAGTAAALCEAGAELVNDTWAGADPEVAAVAAEHGAGLVCSHTGGQRPRTLPHRVRYADVVDDVVRDTTALAERAAGLGVAPESLLLDPTHDFGKNTYHSLELTRRLDELVGTGWPVLVSLSRKDFVGETLGLPVGERLPGTLGATAISAWHGARVFRAHDVAATRQVLDMVAAVRGDRRPVAPYRGLA
ncbi:dihydropteroate synthase [Haloactinopolyspora alba]|uniref:Dihydropteroate synthase n=1 Tax=Haloactinopolyspora alba TaxID=648780 RepID=A0A2P8DXB2_9ACTN|nr:dihydropteroate synthase [Haloactinopolyspora alba]PSL01853.1 dihydropteroate synthase [Haloactinopolyspora alba]